MQRVGHRGTTCFALLPSADGPDGADARLAVFRVPPQNLTLYILRPSYKLLIKTVSASSNQKTILA